MTAGLNEGLRPFGIARGWDEHEVSPPYGGLGFEQHRARPVAGAERYDSRSLGLQSTPRIGRQQELLSHRPRPGKIGPTP
ncbi:MAG: hypothetical protein R3338_06490 [Thermoanaerobaculia bacterium]|nr:hypothetical protein [Thermoanaerobaculia bacterium]